MVLASVLFSMILISGFTMPSYSEYMSPKKQSESGILPLSISCKDNLELVIKFTDNSPSCVTQSTSVKLLERGWGSTLEKLTADKYDSPLDYPYGLYTANMPSRHPIFSPLVENYGTSHNNPQSFEVASLGFYETTNISQMNLPPPYVPEGMKLKLTFSDYRESTDSNILTYFYLPTNVNVDENEDTLIDIWNYNGILILIKTHLLPDNQDLDLWMEGYAEQDDMKFVKVNNIDALMSNERDPFKGESSEVIFYNDKTQIDIISLAHSGPELLKIAQSMFE